MSMQLKQITIREYRIEEVSVAENPDIMISDEKNVYDFMTIGMMSLIRTIEGDKRIVIKVARKNKDFLWPEKYSKETISSDRYPQHKVKQNSFLEKMDKMELISEYLTEGLEERYRIGIKSALLTAPLQFTMKVDDMEPNQWGITIPEYEECYAAVGAQRAVLNLVREVIDMVGY